MAQITFYSATTQDEEHFRQLLGASGHELTFIHEPLSHQNLTPNSEGIATFVTDKVTAEVIAKMPNLRFIACRATGYDNIDMSAARERGIVVLTVPTYGEHTVAEFTFALLLTLSRKIPASHHAALTGDIHEQTISGHDLAGKTIGIIGTGKIGRNVARIAKGFAMDVLAYDPYPNEVEAARIGFTYTSLSALAAQSDVISLHAPATKQNYHLVDDQFLSHVRPTAILLNTARGSLVDSASLLHALQENRLGGAGLDVLEHEELLHASNEAVDFIGGTLGEDQTAKQTINTLKGLPNVLLTPHNAYNTQEALDRIRQTTAQNITDFYEGRTPNQVKETMQNNGQLLITRHCESEWNALGKWTGSTDVHLSENGFKQAATIGEAVKEIHIDYAFASQQIRTLETLESILDASGQVSVPYQRSESLNERDYGDYTGMNKWEVRDKVGEEEWNKIRRDWDHAVPNGETLKMVYERAVPFYQQVILPMLREGKTVLVVAHGNSIRSLIKYLENISDEDIAHVEMPFGSILDYKVADDGRMEAKSVMKIDLVAPPA
ncbi:MAG TPA: 2,3-bisphosphoglycerate-dependent phosphoglycerate mutase [Candidatus Saccharimonadales bacterium]|nr:2,3-bisphosphoglycerate-dependent phosphoglycerate mutase [Candidatus Saccharimonadales bacterium]